MSLLKGLDTIFTRMGSVLATTFNRMGIVLGAFVPAAVSFSFSKNLSFELSRAYLTKF